MSKIFVKPGVTRDGRTLVVRDPVTKIPLPAEGAEVELTMFIRRRMRDGDVVKASRQSTPTKAAPVAAEKKG